MRIALVAAAFSAATLLAPVVAQQKPYEPGMVSTVKTKAVHYAIRVPKKRPLPKDE